ncbi:Ankyrin repeat domain-containing protein [Balamuthia mandrillaris]
MAEVVLPDELLCRVLEMLPPGMLAVAARTCRRWYRCSPAGLRHKLSVRTACSSMALLLWSREHGCPWDGSLCKNAARNGHLVVLKRLREQDCPWDERTCNAAAKMGHLEVLQWARENGCPWNSYLCAIAAKHGHLELLKWAHAHGCPWSPAAYINAARKGHLAVLQWAHESGCEWLPFTCVCAAATAKGHHHIVSWVQNERCCTCMR